MEFSTITDLGTLGLIIKAVWMLSEMKCKVTSLETRIKKLENDKIVVLGDA
jgi:hypothetical protein